MFLPEDQQLECICPVCGYPSLDEPPYGSEGEASFEICPSCGTEFGVDDDEFTHKDLRERWLATGPKWYSKSIQSPSAWNGRKQLKEANLT